MIAADEAGLVGAPVQSGSGAMLCVFTVDGQSFALQAAAVREVIGNAAIVGIPLAPDVMAGLVNYRGMMLTTMSLRRILGRADSSGTSCVVVVRAGSGPADCFGLLVDRLAGVLSLDEDTLGKIPPTVADAAQPLFRGMYLRDHGPLIELEADHLRPEWLMKNRESGY